MLWTWLVYIANVWTGYLDQFVYIQLTFNEQLVKVTDSRTKLSGGLNFMEAEHTSYRNELPSKGDWAN